MVAFLFPGQGAQSVGMGKDLYEAYQEFRAVFEEASGALGFSVSDICFKDAEKLGRTAFCQPAILTMSYACYKLIEHRITPAYTAGLSLGEYSALTVSGAFTFADAVKLVYARGRFMEEAANGEYAMAAVLNLPAYSVVSACEQARGEGFAVYAANFNTPEQTVISGEKNGVARASEIALALGARRVLPLSTSGPFHTPLLSAAAERLIPEVKKYPIGTMKYAVVSNVTARPVDGGLPELLGKQAISPVRFSESVSYMLEQGVTTFIEIGCGRVLSGFVSRIDKTAKTMNVGDINSLREMLAYDF